MSKYVALLPSILLYYFLLAQAPKQQNARAAVMDKQAPIDVSDFKAIKFEKEASVSKMIKAVMEESLLFRKCKREEKTDILDAFEPVSVKAG